MRAELLLLLSCCACAGSPEQQAVARPLARSVRTVGQLWDQEFSAAAMARDCRHLTATSGRLIGMEVGRLPAGRDTAAMITSGELARIRPAVTTANAVAADEVQHTAAISVRPLTSEFDAAHWGRLAEQLRTAGVRLFRLDHRPLPDPRDPEHRTGDAPGPPPPSLLERILLRILP